MTRISRDEEGIAVAEAAKGRADCSRRQVGAALMLPDGSIPQLGRNGLASGKPGCLTERGCPRGWLSYAEQPADAGYAETGCRSIHAEANVLLRAGRDKTVGATLYVTERPCFGCSVLIEGAGIVRCVWPQGEWLPQEQRFDVPATAPSPSDAAPAATITQIPSEPPVKIGDPDPTGGGPFCTEAVPVGGFACTLEAGHSGGWHISGDGDEVLAVWPTSVSNAEREPLIVPGPPHDREAALAPEPGWLAALRRQEERVAAHRATAARRAELAERYEGWKA